MRKIKDLVEKRKCQFNFEAILKTSISNNETEDRPLYLKPKITQEWFKINNNNKQFNKTLCSYKTELHEQELSVKNPLNLMKKPVKYLS